MNFTDFCLDLDLLQCKDLLVISEKNGVKYVMDPVRKKNIILQPEEMVRQLLLQWFITKTVFGRNQLQVEKLISINDQAKRFDIVVYNKSVQPYILVECKAPGVTVDQNVFDQISVYNTALKAPYLMVSNGLGTWLAEQDFILKKYNFFNKLPDWLLGT